MIKEAEIRECRRRYSLLDYVIIQAPGTYDGDSDSEFTRSLFMRPSSNLAFEIGKPILDSQNI